MTPAAREDPAQRRPTRRRPWVDHPAVLGQIRRLTTACAAAGWSRDSDTNCGSRSISTRSCSSGGMRSGLPSTSCTKATSSCPSATMRSSAFGGDVHLEEVSVSGSGPRSRRSQPARARLAVEPIRSCGPPAVAAAVGPPRRGRASRPPGGGPGPGPRRPSGVGRQPVRSRENSRRPAPVRSGAAGCSTRAGHAELAGGLVQAAGVGDGAQRTEVPDLKLHGLSVGRVLWSHQTHESPPKSAVLSSW